MSQETEIGQLNNSISDEDSKLVDSILNDLNNPGEQQGPPQRPMQGQGQGPMQGQGQGPMQGQGELSPEQIKAIQMQRQQMAMQQQLMAQQQHMAAQQAAAQQAANQRVKKEEEENTITPPESDNLVDNIKNESKSIILVIFLSIVLNLEQVDNLFKMQPGLFVSESGSVNMQCVFVKALIIGSLYYGIKTYLL